MVSLGVAVRLSASITIGFAVFGWEGAFGWKMGGGGAWAWALGLDDFADDFVCADFFLLVTGIVGEEGPSSLDSGPVVRFVLLWNLFGAGVSLPLVLRGRFRETQVDISGSRSRSIR